MLRFCGQDRSETHQVKDFPVFNGKYSTTCYIDETLQALNDMYRKRNLEPSDYLRSLKTVFMHRPYRRMPETGWAVAYLFALSQGNTADQAELASYCYEAGIEPERLRTEMMSQPSVSTLASPERLQYEIYPLTMAALRVFRASRHYRVEVLDKLDVPERVSVTAAKLDSPHSRVRANAVKSLLRTELHQAGEVLLDMLDSESRTDRLSALWVVRRSNSVRSFIGLPI